MEQTLYYLVFAWMTLFMCRLIVPDQTGSLQGKSFFTITLNHTGTNGIYIVNTTEENIV